ncbi:hypothetical protein Maq22A_1p38565 (plasmid) [Methylobacterium aquaticum]|uniref:Uncharacterized protein n=1 Tax=Methylobacterium aquaticum TaxID=270351 RepID=A0A1Y0ZCG6_9HYPH|nr:hypothetical protein Maq22A_1p38565 [Methylobacterium aquaticum]
MTGCLRRSPPAACRRGAPARDRPCPGLARATVRKYASVEAFPARLPHGAGPSLLDPHAAYLAGRIDEGCENAMALWREIRERGDPGTSRQGHRLVAERRTRPVRSGRPLWARASVHRSGPARKLQCRPQGKWRDCSPSPPQGGMRAMQPWCGPQGRAGPSLMIRMRTPQRTSPPGSRKHGAATLLPSRRSPRDWRRISRPSGLLSRSHGVAASGRPGQNDSSSSSASRARCGADRDQRPRQRGDRGLGRIERGISDPAALLRGRPALGDGNGAGRARGADGDGGAPLRRWSRPYPASASSRSASTWAARWSASRSSTRSITAS